MATESPIRMTETRQKWPSHKMAATYASSSTTMVDEVRQAYRSGSTIVPNRSGSAPPSVEGSIVAIGNLLQSSASHVAGNGSNFRSASLGGSSNESSHLSRGILPTHKKEPEDGKSPQQASVDWTGRNSTASPERESSVSVTRNRSLVKLPREDSSCPAVGHDSSQTSPHLLVGEASDHDICHMSQDNQTVVGLNALASSSNTEEAISCSDAGVTAATASTSSSHDGIGGAFPFIHKDDSNLVVPVVEDTVVSCDSHIANIQSGMDALRISHPPDSGSEKIQDDKHGVYHSSSIVQQQTQHPTNLQFQGSAPQIVSQGLGSTYAGINQISTAGKSSSQDVQPFFQSSGVTPPFYAASAAYTPYPFYPTVQTPGFIYPPNYGIGGYAFNTAILPPYYSPQSNVPLTFDGVGTHNNNIRISVLPSVRAVDMQQFNKFYGLLGVVQPHFIDASMQLHQPFPHVYNVPGHVDGLARKDGAIGAQVSAFNSHVGPRFAAFPADSRSEYQGAAGQPNLIQRRGKITGPTYFGTPTTPGALMHISSSTMGSPVMRAPFIAGDGFPGGVNEQSSSPTSARSSRLYANWPGHRASRNLNSPRTYSILDELKSGRGQGFELCNVAGHVAELSVDQHGSRFIQQKLEHCGVEEKASVFAEVLPHASKLMTDVFGNYVIQKFFEFGSPEQRKELASKLTGQILSLSLQMYGCRVIQKALDAIELDQKVGLVRELDGHVMACVRDQNGNHVIQKCIECIPIEKIDFIIYAFRGHIAKVSQHPYGCRVIQRVLERCTNEVQSQFVVGEILESVCALAQDQYGNYVTQYILEKGKPRERSEIIRKLSGQIVQMSQHKFASNVIEKCLEYGDDAGRELLIGEIIGNGEGNDSLLVGMLALANYDQIMMKDQYANYVVQKVLEKCTDNQRDMLHSRVKGHFHTLKKYTYGKHIVSCFEQHFGEETQASGS